VPNCAEGGVIGALPGLLGTIQALEVIKLLTGIGEPLSGKLMLWDALSMTTRVVKFSSDPKSRQITELPPEGYGETCAVPAEASAHHELRDNELLPPEIDTTEFVEAAEAGRDLQVVDVREEWERMMGAIEPSVLVPLSALERGHADVTALDPAKATVVYCAAGVRSIRGAELLRTRHGFRNVTSLRGGIHAWARQHS
jgi:adenylyltransferase/sulfurtransferase